VALERILEMTTYYNENDPFAVAWLRNLVAAKLIAEGDVDERSIAEVRPDDLRTYGQCHFFAGIGGWSYALRLSGWPDDVPVWTGSCPCQPFSSAGRRGGFADDRHLWPVWKNLIAERRPAVVFGEQVASAAQWLGLVRGDLEEMGYAVGCCPIEAASAGADHLRDRFWFVAHGSQQQHGSWNGRSRRRDEYSNSRGIDLADDDERSQGRSVLPERTGERVIGAGSVVDDPRERRREGWTEHAVRSGRPTATESNILGNGDESRAHAHAEESASRRAAGEPGERCNVEYADRSGAQAGQPAAAPARYGDSADAADCCDWVIGADGKARRVKSGVRLLVDEFPNRVGLLRGFGNAIDPRPASAFVTSAVEAMYELRP
jgi:DNA (cytosine-5)-methyltransferase 1